MVEKQLPNPAIAVRSDFSTRVKRNTVRRLLERNPGPWSKGVWRDLPFLVRVRVVYDQSLELNLDQIAQVRALIGRMVQDLPDVYHPAYHYCLDILDRVLHGDKNEEMEPVRAVEYLALAGARFVLDLAEVRDGVKAGSEGEVSFQGISFRSVVQPRLGTIMTRVFILHNCGRQVDPLIDDSLKLAAETIGNLLQGKEPLDLVGILRHKSNRYSHRKSGHCSLISRISSLARALRGGIGTLLLLTRGPA